MSDRPTDDPFSLEFGGGGYPLVVGSGSAAPDEPGDRQERARKLADAFATRFPPTLPPPGSDQVPGPGRHVRLTAETPGQLYLGGHTFVRDARAKITARATGMPVGWSVRLTVVDANLVALTPGTPASRADPAVLRAQRQMSDPAATAALAAPLREAFRGRPIHAETHSLFVPAGLIFLREASVVLPLPDRSADDLDLLARLTGAAARTGPRADGTTPSTAQPPPPRRRGHLRIIQ